MTTTRWLKCVAAQLGPDKRNATVYIPTGPLGAGHVPTIPRTVKIAHLIDGMLCVELVKAGHPMHQIKLQGEDEVIEVPPTHVFYGPNAQTPGEFHLHWQHDTPSAKQQRLEGRLYYGTAVNVVQSRAGAATLCAWIKSKALTYIEAACCLGLDHVGLTEVLDGTHCCDWELAIERIRFADNYPCLHQASDLTALAKKAYYRFEVLMFTAEGLKIFASDQGGYAFCAMEIKVTATREQICNVCNNALVTLAATPD